MDLEVSEDGGQTWTPLAQNVAPTGGFTWDTTNQANGFYLLRLVAWSDYGKIVRRSEPFYIENPRRNPPVVSLVQPRGGQVWSGTQEVRWHAEDADGDQLSINLAYSLDAGATWHLFAYGVANTGSYIWDTTTIPNCETVWLRISASDGQFTRRHQSQEPFKVLNLSAPVIQLLSPLGGEEWFGQQNIVWRAASEGNRPLKVMVELSMDEGRNWQALATDLPAQGSLAWDTSTVPEGRCLLRAIASDGMRRAIAQVAEPVTVRGNPVSARPTPSAEELPRFSYP